MYDAYYQQIIAKAVPNLARGGLGWVQRTFQTRRQMQSVAGPGMHTKV